MKPFREFITPSLIIINLLRIIDPVKALRCVDSCEIGPVKLGSADPIDTLCETININVTTTACSVFLQINFQTSYVHGTIRKIPSPLTQLPMLDVSSTIRATKTMTFINYYCTTHDDCDQEFVRETISSSRWTQINETKVRTDMASLLFLTTPWPQTVFCDNSLQLCPPNAHCHAQLIKNDSILTTGQINFNNKFPCNVTVPSQVEIVQHSSATYNDQYMIINIYCNKDRCNQQSIGKQIYDIIENDFKLPLNFPTYVPKPNDSNRLQFLISHVILALLLNYHLYFVVLKAFY